jgi:hypothetical protein
MYVISLMLNDIPGEIRRVVSAAVGGGGSEAPPSFNSLDFLR